MRRVKLWLDRILIVHFFLGALLPAYQVLFVLRPEGESAGPLLGHSAATIPFELLMRRRMYSLEFWLVSLVTVVYFANRRKIWNHE